MTQEVQTEAAERADVHRVRVGERELLVVGTAHISQESATLVREVIEQEAPDGVCVELDPPRYEALSKSDRFESLDLKQVIRSQQLSTLMLNLVLSSYQKRLGLGLGIQPGTELLEAAHTAEELGIPVTMGDRDVRVTLRRAWGAMPFWRRLWLLSSLLAGMFETVELTEDDLRELRQEDVLSRMMRELGEAFPGLKRVLIDERDRYLAHSIRSTPGKKVVAVVGAGHVEGIKRALGSDAREDEASIRELEHVPPVSPVWKWLGYGIPALILGSIVGIGIRQGIGAAGESLVFWILANGIPASIGAVIALGHPLTVVSAFAGAPVTSLTPVIGAGYLCAFVQAFLRPPLVRELKSVSDDLATPRAWWSNRLLRIFLVFVGTTVGSFIGTAVGGAELLRTLFS
ncbi:MAG: TraB/GumN family protein [Myxococcota bacterium]|nr:TraB/GumN family protein [Myxococcota bacterium]